jgi:hypothetical protein
MSGEAHSSDLLDAVEEWQAFTREDRVVSDQSAKRRKHLSSIVRYPKSTLCLSILRQNSHAKSFRYSIHRQEVRILLALRSYSPSSMPTDA